MDKHISFLTQKNTDNNLLPLNEENFYPQQIFLDLVEGILVVINREKKITFINKRGCELLGYPCEHILGKNWFDHFIPESNRRRVKNVFESIMAGDINSFRSASGQIITSQGIRIIAWHNTVLSNKEGKIISTLSFGKDITEQKEAEDKLRKSEANYRTLVEAANSIILRMDTEGNVTYFNAFAEEFFGYSREEIIGKNVVGTIVPKTESTGRDLRIMITNIGKNTAAYANNENENIRKNGERVWVSWTNKGIYDACGKHIETLCVGNDISKLKETERKLKDSQLKYHNMIESSPECVIVLDGEGIVSSCNSMTEKISGYKREEIIGRHFAQTGGFKLTDLPRLYMLFKKAKKGIFPDSLEIECIRKDKSFVIMEVRGSLLEDGNIQIIATDITERKKNQEKLQAAYQEIKKTQQELIQAEKMAAMGQLAAGISHELNQPLTGIKGMTQTIIKKIGQSDPLKNSLSQIIEQADRMERIIKNVRFFSRRSEFHFKKVDILLPLNNAIELVKEQFSDKNIVIEKEYSKALPFIKGDPNQLQQVFLNLLTNARDALENCFGTGQGKISVRISFIKPAKSIKITVSDNGCGIEEKALTYVMNPFYTTKSPQKGTGLGLAIVYRIIEQHHGTIKIQSKKGIGTTVHFTLPIYTSKKRTRRNTS